MGRLGLQVDSLNNVCLPSKQHSLHGRLPSRRILSAVVPVIRLSPILFPFGTYLPCCCTRIYHLTIFLFSVLDHPNAQMGIPLEDWAPAHVNTWLLIGGAATYIKWFREAHIEGQHLVSLFEHYNYNKVSLRVKQQA